MCVSRLSIEVSRSRLDVLRAAGLREDMNWVPV